MAGEAPLTHLVVAAKLFARLLPLWQPFGLPGLGPKARPGVLTQAALKNQLADLAPEVSLDPRRHQLLLGSFCWWHDQLDAAHALAQAIPDADGSYLHALMHRREPDFGNAAYWFRRVGPHPLAAALTQRAGPWLQARGDHGLAERLLPGGNWDPFAFLDFCEECLGRSATQAHLQLAGELQALEFELWLRHLTGAV